MNRKQRMQNRETASRLSYDAVVCAECGGRGKHWIATEPLSLASLMTGGREGGFWTCDKFYDADGRRLQ